MTSTVEKLRAAGTVSLKLDANERGRIAALASAKKRTPHYLMKEAILEYVRREEARQNFIAAAEASFEHYKETGLHVTLDEFGGWVDAVQTAPDTALPPCHK
jgi:predicted transcriptional regulator